MLPGTAGFLYFDPETDVSWWSPELAASPLRDSAGNRIIHVLELRSHQWVKVPRFAPASENRVPPWWWNFKVIDQAEAVLILVTAGCELPESLDRWLAASGGVIPLQPGRNADASPEQGGSIALLAAPGTKPLGEPEALENGAATAAPTVPSIAPRPPTEWQRVALLPGSETPFDSINLVAECHRYPRSGAGCVSEERGTKVVDGVRVQVFIWLADRLKGARASVINDQFAHRFGAGGFGDLLCGGVYDGESRPHLHDLYHETRRDRWFIEVSFDGPKPEQLYLIQIERDEATAWLAANGYPNPYESENGAAQHPQPANKALATTLAKESAEAAKPTVKRRRRQKGDAKELLDSALDSLISKGDWGKTDQDIITLADISRDSFYRLAHSDNAIAKKIEDYKHRTVGRGPARQEDL
jgi:hypothetical protein